MALNVELTLEQQRAVLVRLGWHPANVRGLDARSVHSQLNSLLAQKQERVEFEILRQVGRAWDSEELHDLPSA